MSSFALNPRETTDLHRPIIVVQGAQYGSEAKGAITAYLTLHRHITLAIRTGTVNAGHTVYYKGVPYAMQQLPVSWIKPDCKLVIGPGAYIHPEVLCREINLIREATGRDPRERIYIDYRCGLHLPSHTGKAKEANRHHKMGATGKGCSEAVVNKIKGRGADGRLFLDWYSNPLEQECAADHREMQNLMICDTVKMVNDAYDVGERIIVEGTQGTLLDLHTGPYPYTTHKQTLAGNWLSEAGLSPALDVEIVSVARTYPIRVAGNSGPLPQEISWLDLAIEVNQKRIVRGLPPLISPMVLKEWAAAVRKAGEELTGANPSEADVRIEYWDQSRREMARAYVSELHATAIKHMSEDGLKQLRQLFELTTVTKKLRRIARLDMDSLIYSCRLNRPKSLVITFMDYQFPDVRNQQLSDIDYGTLGEIIQYVNTIEFATGVPVEYFTTGPEPEHVVKMASAIDEFRLRTDCIINGESAASA